MKTGALGVLLFALAASAQQKPAIPAIGETIEVSLVNLDVIVTDKAGQRVHGLTKDDFEVFENGKPQPISNFTEYSGGPAPSPAPLPPPKSAAEGGGAPLAPPHQRRTIVVFIERFFLQPYRIDPFFSSMKKMLHDIVRPGDRAMIVTWNRGVLLTAQGFTDSLPKLDHAVDAVAKLSSTPVADLRQDTRFMIDFVRGMESDNPGNGQGEGLAGLETDSIAQIEKWSQERKIQTINGLIRSVAADEGKKIMVLVTHRLSRTAGLDTFLGNSTAATTLETKASMLERLAAVDMSKALKSIDDTANANGVTIYPMFPEGLDWSPADSSESQAIPIVDHETLANERSALIEIADETGGLTAWGPDTATLLPSVAQDLESYYSLAYQTKSSGADRARKVVVRAKNPALVVRTRREFMDKSDTTRMEDRVIAALFGNPPSPGFPLHVTLGKKEAHGKTLKMPLAIYIPVSALTQLQTGANYDGAFSVYFAWGGKLGGLSDTSHATRTYAIPAQKIAEARQSGHLTYSIELNIDPHTERVAFGVFDEISKDYALRLIQLR